MARKASEPGKLIVFEGPDNVGKTTVSKRLVSTLRRRGINVHWHSFPGHAPGTLGAEVYALHHARRMRSIDPLSRQLLHLAAHVDLIARDIKPALRRGEWVVLDRYWWSAEIYGLAAGAHPKELQKALRIEQHVWEPFQPWMAFLLVRQKGHCRNQQEISLPSLYKRVAARESRHHSVIVLRNDSTLDALFQQVISTQPLHTFLTP